MCWPVYSLSDFVSSSHYIAGDGRMVSEQLKYMEECNR
jgi:hypothetical protein